MRDLNLVDALDDTSTAIVLERESGLFQPGFSFHGPEIPRGLYLAARWREGISMRGKLTVVHPFLLIEIYKGGGCTRSVA